MDQRDVTQAVPLRLNLDLLEQAAAAAKDLASIYETPLPGGRSSIGTHMRHVVDHYDCLLSGLAEGRIDYYTRNRDSLLESDSRRVVSAFERIRDTLADVNFPSLDTPLEVGTGGPDQEDGERGWAPSSVRRELAFVLSHTLHHLAMIRGMALELGVDLGGQVGVAHSTLKHRRGATSTTLPGSG
ncbi:MAG: DinB family protein [Longimicrobiales bacterium]